MRGLVFVVLLVLVPGGGWCSGGGRDCRPITSSFCQGLGYSGTLHPSGLQGYSLQQVGQMVETRCSPAVAVLLCRVVLPECPEDSGRTKPCRALCEKVKADCEATFRTKRLTWPSRLRCDALPQTNCVQGLEPRVTLAPPPACQSIAVPLCSDSLYSHTLLPNLLGHTTQEEAALQLQLFMPFVKVECSPHLKPFLCSVFVPECVAGTVRPPCRTQCEEARAGCRALMNNFNFAWPEALRCEAFGTDNCAHAPPHSPPLLLCQTITVPICQDLPYDRTALPNVLGHTTQEEAGRNLHQFLPLITVGCSPHLKSFLCSVHTPECVAGRVRPPCRTLCQEARAGCKPLMNKFGIQWPDAYKCEAFTGESCEHYGVGQSGGICEPITIPMCEGLSYNQTISPNLLGHRSQREAAMKMSFFNSMVQAACSVDIRLFLCRVYAPQCQAGEVQRPCRSFCERAKRGCEGLVGSFGVAWPAELNCGAFPEDGCVSENSKTETLTAKEVRTKLNAGGFSVRGKPLSLKTAHLLLALMDADKSRDLDAVEFFNLEHYVAVIRREYVESDAAGSPSSASQSHLKRALALRDFALDDDTFRTLWQEHGSADGIDYDSYVTLLTKLHILKERFKARLLNVPCDCRVSSFSLEQFINSAII